MLANLTMFRGDDFEFDIVATLNGSALNITGGSLKMTAKQNPTDADPGVFQLTSPSGGITLTNAAAGQAHFVVAGSLTSTLPAHITYLNYDIQLVESTGKIRTLALGTLKILPDVTFATT